MTKHETPQATLQAQAGPEGGSAGATPEALIRALFRGVELLDTRPAGQPVGGNEQPIGQGTAPQPDEDRSHLSKRI